jgi:hypothetical protein
MTWAIRAALDRPLSIRLAFVATLAVALSVGAFGASLASSSIFPEGPNAGPPPRGAMNAAGNSVELPSQAFAAHVERRDRLQAAILLLVATSAWAVVALYALERRWAFAARKRVTP